MTPERWQQIKSIIELVDASAQSDRDGILRRHCGEDAALRDEVERLLSAENSGANLLVASGDMTGTSVGPYRVVRLIGRGGMGDVYAAEDPRLGRQVALKLLPALHTEDETRIRRFQLEARTASALNHPSIVTVHDFGQVDGVFYLATELVQGETLRQMISRGPVPLPDLLAIAAQIAGALAVAHEAGIIHRDIKPENLMVRPDGFVKILDFGLAKLREGNSGEAVSHVSLTTPGMVMGTARYMSPEQTRGLRVDARSDLFSLGAVLYEAAAGHPPFTGETSADLIAAILDRELPPLAMSGEAARKFETVIRKCLRKDREDRYQNCREFQTDLIGLKQEVESGSGSSSNPVELKRRPFVRRVRPAMGLAALIILTGLFYRQRLDDAQWYKATKFSKVPTAAGLNYGVISPDGRYIAYSAIFADGKRSLSVRLLNAESGIELIPPAFVAYYAITFSPDGNYLYYVPHNLRLEGADMLFRVPLLGGPPARLIESNVSGITFSRDALKMAFIRQGENNEAVLFTANPDGANQKELVRTHVQFPLLGFDWSTDGKEIFYSEASREGKTVESEILAIDSRGGTPRTFIKLARAPVPTMRALPDGSGFLTLARDQESGVPQISYLARSGAIRHITHDLNEYQMLSVTADGRKILSGQFDRISQLWSVDLDKPASAHAITEPYRRFDQPVWTQDGFIVAARVTSGESKLWAMSPDGSGQRQIRTSESFDITPDSCPDRPDFVFTSRLRGAYSVWRMRADGSELKQLTTGPYDYSLECQSGGTLVYRARKDNRSLLLQVPLAGGTPAAAGNEWADGLVSPDRNLVLREFSDPLTHENWATIRTRKSPDALATFPFAASAVAWAPDSKGIAYASKFGGHEIWYQPVNGGARKQLTPPAKDSLFWISWSPDAKHLVYSLGRILSDLVVIQDVR
jgi:eukaryotic-like serine/threonine-protein kinase